MGSALTSKGRGHVHLQRAGLFTFWRMGCRPSWASVTGRWSAVAVRGRRSTKAITRRWPAIAVTGWWSVSVADVWRWSVSVADVWRWSAIAVRGRRSVPIPIRECWLGSVAVVGFFVRDYEAVSIAIPRSLSEKYV